MDVVPIGGDRSIVMMNVMLIVSNGGSIARQRSGVVIPFILAILGFGAVQLTLVLIAVAALGVHLRVVVVNVPPVGVGITVVMMKIALILVQIVSIMVNVTPVWIVGRWGCRSLSTRNAAEYQQTRHQRCGGF
jgi:hypothetical protein